ncbi:MAG TPA: MurR/RpiR family transcriptional regulator [Streptosporangiaceae bacterium]|jgi:DNA-binding MurR/RpiR family transcriptional regulator|nr:MurR/RpiR family transcriptional regulator [Streptosporangiaceae bacterium]
MNEMKHKRGSAVAAPARADGRPPADADEWRIAERIRQKLGSLSPSERRVARVLLSGAPTAGLESSAKLADHAGVSGPTVSRFVTQRLGFQNYAEFQQALRDEIAARVVSPVEVYRRHQVGPAEPDFASRSGAALADSVLASLQGLDPTEFARATALLADSQHHVLAVGGAFSQLVAGYLVGVLREIRPGVRLVPPIAAERAAALADIGKRDVLCAFDFRRYESDTQVFAAAAKDAGARLVLFTDPWLSPIADIADAILPAQEAGPSPFPSLAPTVAVTETLITAVAGALGEAGRAHFERFGGIADRWMRFWPQAEPGRDNPLL